MKVTVIPVVLGTLGTALKDVEKKTGGIGDQRKNQDNSDHSITNGYNTLKSPEDLRKITVTQTPER